MTTHWLVARFVRDLRRGEQKNIGIVLFHDGNVYARFLGEDASRGSIDGRTIRPVGADKDNYKAWVHYWREIASEGNLEKLLSRRAGDNYFLERGGRVLSAEKVDPDQLAGRIYAEMVSEEYQPSDRVEDKDTDAIEEVFRSVGAHFHVANSVHVNVESDLLTFDHAVTGPKDVLFRSCKLNGNPEKTWSAVHETVYSVTTANNHGMQSYALVLEADPGEHVPRQYETLQRRIPGSIVRVESDATKTAAMICHIVDPHMRGVIV